jgi:hypothetical protein
MPNSGTVTAGSVALASQYNNLRDDVLNVSTGHKHTGASEDGAQIEGTALKSTGATAGQVLQADGSANAVWVTSAQSGALTSATATVTFAAQAGEQTFYVGVNNTANHWGVFTNGSTIFCIDSTLAVTTSRGARIFAYGTAAYGGSIAASATATLTNAVAGTVRAMMVPYLGFGAGTSSASTAVYYGQLITATSSGAISLNFRKYNLSLSANIWSANFGTAESSSAGTPLVQTGIKYMQECNAWVTVKGASGTVIQAVAYHINDADGALSSANYPNLTTPTGYVFVPSTGGSAAGTVHVWGTSSTEFVRCTYAVDGTSITALSTATNTSAWEPTAYFGPPTSVNWGDAWYDRAEECIVITSNLGHDGYSNGNLIGIDRTFGTQLFNSIQAGTAQDSSRAIGYGSYETSILNEKPFDHVSRTVSWKTSGNLTTAPAFMIMGKPGAYYNASPKAQITEGNDTVSRTQFVTNYSGFTGPGSALRPWQWKTSNYEFVQYAPLNYTQGTVLAAASVGRIVTMAEENTQGLIGRMTLVAKDAFKLGYDTQAGMRSGTVAASLAALARFPMYLPAGEPLVIGFTGRSEGTAAQVDGTATVVFRAINLA